jgi:hypothetical protein
VRQCASRAQAATLCALLCSPCRPLMHAPCVQVDALGLPAELLITQLPAAPRPLLLSSAVVGQDQCGLEVVVGRAAAVVEAVVVLPLRGVVMCTLCFSIAHVLLWVVLVCLGQGSCTIVCPGLAQGFLLLQCCFRNAHAFNFV